MTIDKLPANTRFVTASTRRSGTVVEAGHHTTVKWDDREVDGLNNMKLIVKGKIEIISSKTEVEKL